MIYDMATSHTATPLHRALEQHGRLERRLSVETVAAGRADVLDALTGGRQLEANERLRLARWVVPQLHHQIARLSDKADRRIAQVVLASEPEFERLKVSLRLDHVRENDHDFSDDQFRVRRSAVLAQLAAGLQSAYWDVAAPTVFIGGSYADPAWDSIAEEVGHALADQPVRLIAAMSDPGIHISYGMEKARIAGGRYESPRARLFGRYDSPRHTRARQPYGACDYLHGTRESVRVHLLAQSNLVLLFGGGPGTESEARLAERFEKPIIPLGFTHGTAGQWWRSHHDPADPDSYHRLGSPDLRTAIAATVRLISRHTLSVG